MIGRSRKKIVNDNQAAINDDSLIIVKNDKSVEKSKKLSAKTIATFALIFLLIATAFFAFKFISFNATVMLWKTSLTRGSSEVNNKSIKYRYFDNGLFRISNDGITYIDSHGEVKFAISYNMQDPIYESNNDYFAIADRNASEFYIFDGNGLVGKNTSAHPIQEISITEDGILYVMQSDEDSSYINLYRKNGNPIDISIKSNFTGDGMPIGISASPDGTELLVDYTCLSESSIYSKATYYNFDEVGKSTNAKRIVGEFKDELNDKFLARVHFFDNERSCLVYDGGIIFVSTLVLTNPTITSTIEFEDRIKSISYNDRYFVFVFEDNKMLVLNKTGETKCSKSLDFSYDNFYISDDYIVFLYGNRTMIYDTSGRLIFDKELNQDVQYVAKKKSLFFTELLLGLIDGVECIRFY